MKTLNIIVPCFNEEEMVPLFYKEVSEVFEKNNSLKNLFYTFIFIDDGSSDKTIKTIKNLAENDERVKYISFSRNFGKESAIYAGLESSDGDYILLMDVDLQDPPNLIPEMYFHINSGNFDSVGTRRITREGEPFSRSLFARIFYKIINSISRINIVDGARDYRMMTRQMVDSILQLTEYNRFSKGIFSWVGFKTKWLEYENIERTDGESSWSFWKLFLYSIDGILAFSTVPLAISTIIGIIFSLFAFILILIIFFKTLIFGEAVPGWPSIICAVLLVGGIQLFSVGILGQYLSKTYLETKNRPIYILRETNINNK